MQTEKNVKPFAVKGQLYRYQMTLLNRRLSKKPHDAALLEQKNNLLSDIRANMYVDSLIGVYWQNFAKDELARDCFNLVADKLHRAAKGELPLHDEDEKMARDLLDAVYHSLCLQKYAPHLQDMYKKDRKELKKLCEEFCNLGESLAYESFSNSPLRRKVQEKNPHLISALSYRGRLY